MSVLAQADEFHDIRLRAGEKPLYKDLNKNVGIKFPIKVDVALPAHKVSLLIQTELGGVDFPANDAYKKHKVQHQQDQGVVFQHVNRLIRCIIDCQLHLQDSMSARHALELGRSLAARVWDNSPLQLKQLDTIGNIAVRKLAGAAINNMEALESTEPHRIEAVLQRNPPYGMKLLSKLADFPKLRVSVKQIGKASSIGAQVMVDVRAEIGFLNEKIPVFFNKKPVYVCFMAETSDGTIVDFRRMGAKKVQSQLDIPFQASLHKPTAFISCHVMCDEVAGTCRSAELRLDHVPARLFPQAVTSKQVDSHDYKAPERRTVGDFTTVGQVLKGADDFEDSGLDDGDLLAAEVPKRNIEVMDVDDLFHDGDGSDGMRTQEASHASRRARSSRQDVKDHLMEEPLRLENGKWACNHTCRKENKVCKHKCCKEGVDKARRPQKRKVAEVRTEEASNIHATASSRRKHGTPFEAAHSAFEGQKQRRQKHGTQEARSPDSLHEISGMSKSLRTYSKNREGQEQHRTEDILLQSPTQTLARILTDYDTAWIEELGLEDLPMPEEFFGDHTDVAQKQVTRNAGAVTLSAIGYGSVDMNVDEPLTLKDGMVGLEDSLTLENDGHDSQESTTASEGQSSSEALGNSSSYKMRSSLAVDLFDTEEDWGLFDIPMVHVEPQSLSKRSHSLTSRLPGDQTLNPLQQKGFFATSESSSPYKAHAPILEEADQKQKPPGLELYEDETQSEPKTPLTKKMKHEMKAPCGNDLLMVPLNDVSNFKASGQTAVANVKPESRREMEEKIKREEEDRYEQRQKELWAEAGPDLYEEFGDFVELVDD